MLKNRVRFLKNYIIFIAATAFPLLLFFYILENIVRQESSKFDSSIYSFIAGFITDNMTALMRFFTFWGSGTAMTIIAAVIVITFGRRRKHSFFSWAIGLNLITSSLLNKLFKGIFHRQRPDIYRLVDITGFSFPSGHSMVSICFYGFIVYLLWVKVQSKWKYPLIFLLILLVICIGTSRIYLGVHYASDVLGGFSIGLAWLTVYISLIKKLNYRFAKEKTI